MRFVRAYLPALLLALLVLAVFVGPAFAAPANPTGVTNAACSFSSTWFDGLSRWLFGLSLVLMILAALLSLRNMHTEGPWGAIIAIAGVGVLLGLISQLPTFAPIALAAAGAPACP
jgi:O-antigen ligase